MAEQPQAVDIGNISELNGSAQIVRDKPYQAEDGIRYQPRSRGLGDVYKRQIIQSSTLAADWLQINSTGSNGTVCVVQNAVSYTHLTLPTKA